jgi:hypothetical protein
MYFEKEKAIKKRAADDFCKRRMRRLIYKNISDVIQ